VISGSLRPEPDTVKPFARHASPARRGAMVHRKTRVFHQWFRHPMAHGLLLERRGMWVGRANGEGTQCYRIISEITSIDESNPKLIDFVPLCG